MRVTVFSPDDLAVVKVGPGRRRRFLDDVLVALGPEVRCGAGLEVDRMLRSGATCC